MATTKAKKPAAKKAPAKRTAAKKATNSRSSATRRFVMSRNDEYTQLTWVLVCIWLVLIAIFLATVIGHWR
ncbi:MAG TPA: hypothetical protein VN031_01700 [Candidatus Microsaccharimonas sp.]|nr:hypothetical protein [Candidatus Microsaccharimonas sp.]